MLLIIILGLMAELMAVSGDCDIGTQLVNDFDWNKFSGLQPWYANFHEANGLEINSTCVETTFGSPEGKWNVATADIYDIRKTLLKRVYGYAENWNSTGYFDAYFPFSQLNGRLYVLAVDYDRYVIGKTCPFDSNEASVYVAYRSSDPDETTVNEVLNELKKNNIDINQVVDWKPDLCQGV